MQINNMNRKKVRMRTIKKKEKTVQERTKNEKRMKKEHVMRSKQWLNVRSHNLLHP